ncbi:YajQ family cyclic di-GMP-binding protein [Thermanaerosceptrum fracticalcis]|uniref:Nucleotide-binding protein BR63_08565 n=1 Tax=Thermanaerosceptrum fracticalcis TaxID=1712410 RepID=A0A7G6E2Q8_THEFR|nr:YajQ family cyclic di-GMP-binding protein [Thermanaerosceptrum fracticalcis]QNB46362.1 YajQ family cyclic di-GMP-binding protein [Thermanaerosceptrum fracticalcis]
MAKENSFDIVSEVDLQEVDNAVNQTIKEISQRFDFKGSKADVELSKEDEIKVVADDEYKLKSVIDILQSKMVRRGVSLKFLEYGKIEPAAGGTVRQIITIKKGISKEKGKEIVNVIKNMKLKVQAQIQEDQVRVSGKERDDLQKVIQHLKQQDFGIELQFTNYRTF